MDEYRDLRLVLTALRAGRVDPARLAEVGLDWAPGAATPFWEYLVERGVVAPGPATTVCLPPPAPVGGGETPSFVADGSTPAFPTPIHPARDTVAYSGAAGRPAANGPSMDPAARYEVLRPHRAGGIGEVWLARDTAVGREVALKRLRPERAGDPDLRARFVREARTTGRLEHPCVVPLYDLIEDAGGRGPCYVMRFVAGRTLAEAVADYHARRAKKQVGRLELAALLDAFVAVCRAVAYAHVLGVLHRDLKGQNVVLGDFGEVFLLDWGLAKPVGEADATPTPIPGLADTDQPTRSGAVVGTPAYMAPEVADGGPASKASDVYGLGAVLYTILTGKPPYDGLDPWEVVGKVKVTDPPPPRAVNPDAPPALEAVCRKAMARDPAGRYGTADGLATEVRRWLADEPVAAYRDPWTVRATRWARRHRTTVAAAAVFLLTALVALAASTALVWSEQRRTAEQKRLAEAGWTRAETEHGRAERNFATARVLVLDMSDRISALETGLSNPRSADAARKAALDEARKSFDRFQDDSPEDVTIQRQAAAIHRYAANVSRLLNDYRAAETAYAASLRNWEGLADRFPDEPEYRDNLAETLRDRSMLEKRTGRLRAAAATLSRAAVLAEGLRGRLPESSYRRNLGTVLIERADIEYALGQLDESGRSARQVAELLDGLRRAPADRSNPLDPLLAAIAVNRVAMVHREQGQITEALTAHADAVGRLKALAGLKAGRDVRFWHQEVRREQARTCAAVADRRAAAADDLGEVIAGAEKLVADYPGVPYYREGLAAACLCRGELHALLGRTGPADADLTRSLTLSRELIDRHGLLSSFLGLRGRTFLALARLRAAADNREEAAARLKDAAAVFKVAVKRDPDNHHHRRGLKEAAGAAPPPPR